jgi:hypothetical protein
MAVVPTKKIDRLQWYEQHEPIWTTQAANIGLEASDTTTLATKNTAARDAYTAHLAAQQAAKAATAAWYNAVADLSSFGATLINKIRAKAGVSGPSVYTLAQVPAPAIPAPVGPPGTPTEFSVALDQAGALTLAWKCPNPANSAGTIYHISRRIGATGEFTFIGASGPRAWTDATIPAGSASVTYQVVAVRSTAIGNPAQFTVNFGTTSSGQAIASVEAAPAPAAPQKLAA